MEKDIYQKSLEFHILHGGKIDIVSKVPVKDRDTLSMVYTPGVAEVCRAISKDISIAKTATLKGNTVGIISDGSAILGLGNLGAHSAIPVMEGKAVIFKEFAGLNGFPICLDTQNVDEIVETVVRIAPVFGAINLEDISAPRCFEIEKKLRERLNIPIMHDDQHGTATVVLAGLINSLKLAGKDKENVKIVINGVGAAGTAVAKLLILYGFKHFIFVDTVGVIHKGRTDLSPQKIELLEIANTVPQNDITARTLADALSGADIFIGVSKGDILTQEMVKSMNEKPIIFALANPVPEIMPDIAKDSGAFIIATGRSDYPNQVNNALAYPGIFKGALDSNLVQFEQEMFIDVALALANCVESPTTENILPDIFNPNIVRAIVKVFTDKNVI
jgi:malate dehydrogenase (oxaloacetate-decarboxylating)